MYIGNYDTSSGRNDAGAFLMPARLRLQVRIRQGSEKGDDVVDFRVGEGGCVARLPAEGRVLVEIVPIGLRQVVIPADRAVGIFRIPAAGIAVARRIEGDDVAQRVEIAVVEEALLQRDIAQCRRAEQAAIFAVAGKVGTLWAAEAEIVIVGVAIG